ncbi:hypothetical protein [Nocardioides sp. Iso805N]|uniref:hypothetical protein n=1 Tax=Nocardioides sp. Iso805N TaxID=1283287 RepID=UPI0003803EBB|nr:hypothetical protein [Nocardioides sp. Iso805N]
MRDDDLAAWLSNLLAAHENHSEATHEAYQHLENAGVLSRLTVHRYICARCGPLATVIRVGTHTLARTKDYKYGRGLNDARSVPAARASNTLDGERHWPGHTFDVDELAEWGEGVGFDVHCRHQTTTVAAREVLATTRNKLPGHPGAPTIL